MTSSYSGGDQYSDPFEQGEAAFMEEKSIADCPYKDKTNRSSWMQGFAEMKKAMEAVGGV